MKVFHISTGRPTLERLLWINLRLGWDLGMQKKHTRQEQLTVVYILSAGIVYIDKLTTVSAQSVVSLYIQDFKDLAAFVSIHCWYAGRS